ncbi:helix-turn-helix transcriptional regulator [Rhodococcus sp. IEGM 1305]|uniref:helix-turn-helix transcriptional regulator n=2 Tax=unclassified Rhodococcus (in: high G+C Gram-positive bacteria) TaxID=192944 RepID=UPI0024B66918|nr:helix-turn-helix transcriptional regulator [Rhodococcus sp. IEGM 1305]MDI9952872.1 helix-turn-helix transcriptional regulator [Rhodococcus sp. IEGM 1305]
MTAPNRYGRWLGANLQQAGMSQAQLAIALGLTRAAVSAWIAGRAEPREELKERIVTILEAELPQADDRSAIAPADRNLQWHHRPAHTDGGREYGNAAAFAFNADLSVLAREATQNSIDERLDHNAPVRVHYTLHELTDEHLESFLSAIQWGDLSPHLESAARAEQKVSRSLRAALNELAERQSLVLLRIDDFNASGLNGPEYENGNFAAVVRRQLDSHKQSVSRAGGSYGLGKATLWATSKYGLVLINSTLSEPHDGHTERRVIGRLDLPWHEVEETAYAGPAWFGTLETDPEREGVSRSWWATEQMVRDLHLDRSKAAPGTSFLIVGAHDASGDAETLQEMHDKLVRSLADAFWAAMVGGKAAAPLLDAHVTTLRNHEIVVSEQRVDPHQHHPALSRALRAYLDDDTVETLTAADQVAHATVPLVVTPRKGKASGRSKGALHDCVLLVTPAADNATTANRVICIRGNRMTIAEHRPREIPLGTPPFQAVLLAGYATGREGTEVAEAEAFLRASEPPEHDKWDRTEELTSSYEKGALTRLKEFRSSIDKTVRGVVGQRDFERNRGPKVLRELLKLENPRVSRPPIVQGAPSVHHMQGSVDDTGAWSVTVTVKAPESEDPWLLTPIAKFDVRSGGRPTVRWTDLTAVEGCRVDGENLRIEARVRQAIFVGVTDPATHPVKGRFARILVEVPKVRGGAA